MNSTQNESRISGDSCGFTLSDPAPSDDCTEYFGESSRYRLAGELGHGGMGIVYRARDLKLNRDIAIKILRCKFEQDPEISERFINEAKILGALQHPGIVNLYDYGLTDSGHPYLAMKLVEGKTLSGLLSNESRASRHLGFFLDVLASVSQAMAYTHSQGIAHLDLKPSNIMVGEFGEVRLTDWGLAQSVCDLPNEGTSEPWESRDTTLEPNRRTVHGTLAYMAPEQANGKKVCKRTDVFCLGAMLCEILTGRPPYHAKDKKKAYRMARKADLEQAHQLLSRCSVEPRLIRLAKVCLSVSPEDRLADAGVVANEMSYYHQTVRERAENDMTRFFELSLDLFCIAGFDGYFRRINDNFSRVLGYPERHLLSRPFLDFVVDEDREKTRDVMGKLLDGHPVIRFRNRYRAVCGKALQFEWTAKSIVDENVIFAVARNIT